MEEKELGKTVKLEESRKAILREILEDQFSLVESLKESLGIKSKLTEFENSQLKKRKSNNQSHCKPEHRVNFDSR